MNQAIVDDDITIEPYAAQFQSQVVSLILGIQRDEFGISISLDDQPDLLEIDDYYRKRQGNFWIAAKKDDVLLGTIALLDVGEQTGVLRKMFVLPEARGKERRVAFRLLTTLLSWATTHHFKTIYLGTTDKFLASHRFYEKNGFTPVEPDDLPAIFPRMTVDNKFYKIIL